MHWAVASGFFDLRPLERGLPVHLRPLDVRRLFVSQSEHTGRHLHHAVATVVSRAWCMLGRLIGGDAARAHRPDVQQCRPEQPPAAGARVAGSDCVGPNVRPDAPCLGQWRESVETNPQDANDRALPWRPCSGGLACNGGLAVALQWPRSGLAVASQWQREPQPVGLGVVGWSLWS